MSDHLILISDGEDDATPPSKRARKNPTPTILNLDFDPTPQKQPPGSASTTPLFIDETPISEDATVVKSSFASGIGVSLHCDNKFSDDSTSWMWRASFRSPLPDDTIEVDSDHEKEDTSVEKMGRQKQTRSSKSISLSVDALPKKLMSKDEKIGVAEEKKLRKEQEKLQKAALKAEEAEYKKLEMEKKKWAKDKALKSIVTVIDNKLVEGPVGGFSTFRIFLQHIPQDLLVHHESMETECLCYIVNIGCLTSGLIEKGITYRVTSNSIERSIVWTMTLPDDIAQTLPLGPKIPYVLLVSEAEEFCNLVTNKELQENISRVQDQYPSYTMCYLTHKLLSYVNKKERVEYKDPVNRSGWRKPPIDEALAKLTTHYIGVHSRHCVDEAEVAEHIVRLTSNLAYCQFRKKLTRLSVSADGTLMSKNAVDKHLLQKSSWLKALVTIPKVQPRYAVAVSKKYPSMKSLLKVYMDPNISGHEKECLLKDLKVENLVGGDTRVGEICSNRIYRVLMSTSGTMKTDDVENSAASFRIPPYDLD